MELPRNLRQTLLDLARRGVPNEVCGYLAGLRGDSLRVREVYGVQNALLSPTAFALDGQSMIDAERQIEEDGLELLGVFHSHPTSPAVPSPRDRGDAGSYDPFGYLAHLIVSLARDEPEVRAWSYGTDGQSMELDIIDETVK